MTHSTIARIVANSVSLANESGKIIRRVFKNGDLGIVNKEGIKNYQTEADRAVERLIVSSIKTQYPNISVIGEEDQVIGLTISNQQKKWRAREKLNGQ